MGWTCQRHGVVNHVGHVERRVALGDLHDVVRVVAVLLAVFHLHAVGSVDVERQVVKTTVTRHNDAPFHREMQVIHIVGIRHLKRHVHVRVADVGALHIVEELLVEVVLKLMRTLREALERQVELTELSHSLSQLKNCAKLGNF